MSMNSRWFERAQFVGYYFRQRLATARAAWAKPARAVAPTGMGLEPLEQRQLLNGLPTVLGFHINEDAAQRSMVTSIAVQFSEDVSGGLSTDDLVVHNLTTNQDVAAGDMALAYDGATDTATLTFPGLVGGSLANGNYTVTLNAPGITNAEGDGLDGNGDGLALGAARDNYGFDLYRYFGDSDGDRDVDNLDLFRFRQTFPKSQGQAGFNPLFDSDADGDADNLDLFRFRQTFTTALAAPVSIQASLNNDTAPPGSPGSEPLANDGITSDPGITGRVAFHNQAAAVRWGLDDVPVDQYADITSQLGLNGGFVLDQDQLESLLGGAITDGAHTLHLTAQDADGNALSSTDVSFVLKTTPVTITEISPAHGEEMVNVTRETIVRFDGQIDPDSVIGDPNSDSDDAIYLIANGQRVPGRLVVSSTNLFATFFYDVALPASTEVRVVVEGGRIYGVEGLLVDGDGDSAPGGAATADFRTLPLTRIPGTKVFGYVYDSYNKNPDGSERPVVGATIRVDAFPEANVVTDTNGYFELVDMPAPEFFVHVDGSTATNTPAGFVYPSVGKPFHSVPGQRVQLEMDGETFHVYLPPMAAGDVTELSPTETTEVGFGNAGKAELHELFPEIDPSVWDLVKVNFAPGSAVDDQGNAATQAVIIPVPPDRLPAPLPPGVDPKLVISIQAPGATNFDVPVPVTFPNLEGLAPGEKTLIFSFDHDAGVWRTVGTATVSEDGLTVVSDPGVGIVAPGWHFVLRGINWLTRLFLGDGDSVILPERWKPFVHPAFDPAVLDAVAQNGSSIQSIDDIRATGQYVYDRHSVRVRLPEGLSPGSVIDQMLDQGPDVFIGFDDFSDSAQWGRPAIGTPTIGEIYSLSLYVPGITDLLPENRWPAQVVLSDYYNPGGDAGYWDFTTISTPLSALDDDYVDTFSIGDIELTVGLLHPASGTRRFGYERNLDGSYTFYTSSISRSSSPAYFIGEGGIVPEWLYSGTLQDEAWENFAIGLGKKIKSLGGEQIGMTGREVYRSWVPPEQIVCPPNENEGVLDLRAIVGDTTPVDAVTASTENLPARLYYIAATKNAVIARGSVEGSVDLLPAIVGPPDEKIHVVVADPLKGFIGNGILDPTNSRDPILELVPIDDALWIDSDNDTLADVYEFVIGTNRSRSDTDNDGIPDSTELEQNLDPLDDRGFPIGLISSLPLQGPAKELVVESRTVDATIRCAALGCENIPPNRLLTFHTTYVATGSHGLAVVDVSRFNNPIVLGQLDLPGDATDVAVDSRLQIAAVASGTGGLHLVDVSDPMLPNLIRTIAISNANQVEILDGVAYVNSGAELRAYDVLTGERLQVLLLPGGTNITGMAREGSMLYTMDANRNLRAVDLGGVEMVRRGSLALITAQGGGGKLFVGGGVAYVAAQPAFSRGGFATVNVSNPDSFILISGSDVVSPFVAPGTAIVPNGSGIGLLVGAAGGTTTLDLMDVSELGNTNVFVTRINLPTAPFNAAIASGIAFVAGGTAGLQVVNYLSFDNQGVAPGVTLDLSSLDLDAGTAGIQVQEGTTIPVRPVVSDDQQVRNVELLVNGTVVRNDSSFPYDFTAVVPALADGSDTVTIQVRATDTGGNTTTSDPQVLQIRPDTFAPTVHSVSPEDGAIRGQNFRTVRVAFNESMDEATLTAENIELFAASDPSNALVPVDIQIRGNGQVVQLTYGSLEPGEYHVVVHAADVTDRVGNALGAGDLNATSFTVVEATIAFTGAVNNSWHDARNWDTGELPGPDDDVFIGLPGAGADATILYSTGTTRIKSLISDNKFTLSGGVLDVSQTVQVNNEFKLAGGTLKNATVLRGEAEQGVTVTSNSTLDGVTLDTDMVVQNAVVLIYNGLTLNDQVVTLANASADLRFYSGTQTLGGTGTVILGGSSSYVYSDGSATLTIGPGITIDGAASGNVGWTSGTTINQGLIRTEAGTITFHGPWQNLNQIDARGGTVNLGGSFATADVVPARLLRDGTSTLNITGVLNNDGPTVVDGSSGGHDGLLGDGNSGSHPRRVVSDAFASGAANALRFDGIDDYVSFGDVLDAGTGDLTVEAWFNKATASTDLMKIVNKGLTSAGTPRNAGYHLRIRDGILEFGVHDGNQFINVSVAEPTINEWHHAAGVLDRSAGEVRLYLNGDLVATTSVGTLGSLDTNIPLAVGVLDRGEFGAESEFFNGQIDEVRIWNVARDEASVQADKDQTLAGTETGLVGYWGFDEPLGETFTIDAGPTWRLHGGRINGGVVDGEALVVTPSDGTLDGVTLDTDMVVEDTTHYGQLSIYNGLVLNSTLRLRSTAGWGSYLDFYGSGTQVLSGTGRVVFDGTTNLHYILPRTNGMTLQIGSGIEIEAGGGGGTIGSGDEGVVNQGAIMANGRPLTMQGTWTNEGTVDARAGTLSIGSGTWTNPGTIDVRGSTVSLGGTFTVAEVATDRLLRDATTTLNLTGTLNNAGSTFVIDAGPTWRLHGGRINGGVVDGEALVVTPSDGTLDGVTLDTDMVVEDTTHYGQLSIYNGLVLNSTLRLRSTAGWGSYLDFYGSGTQVLSGTGRVVFDGTTNLHYILPRTNGMTLQIGSGIEIEAGGGGGTIGSGDESVINQGRISGNNRSVTVSGGTMTNRGILETFAGTLTLNNLAPNEGTIRSGPGGLVTINGSFTNTATGNLETALGGTLTSQFGRFAVTGSASLNGTLRVSLANSFVPVAGNTFQVMTYASRTGMFASINDLDPGDGIGFNPTYGATTLTLMAV